MRIPFRLVDVFTERPLAGNQLCVVPDPVAGIEAVTMQALAKEMGFSETTFVTSSGGDRYSMRIFTPDEELPFAGHPTLGTAFVMVSEGRVSSPATQVVALGEIPVEADVEAGWALMRQLPPEFGPEFTDRDLLASAIGLSVDELHPDLPAQVVSTGLPPLVVPIRDLDALRRASRRPELVREVIERSGGDRYSMRIFTPDQELPFAGHPTLGTAFVLASEGRVSSPATQVVALGEIPVEADVERGWARMRQLPPEFGPEFTERDLLASAVGLSVDELHPDLPAQVVSTGLPPLVVPIRDLDALRRASRRPELVREVIEHSRGEEMYMFAIGEDGGVTARFFDAGAIGEDPATGSAVGPLGAYLARRGLAGMPGKIVVRQGEQVGRPSQLHVEAESDGETFRIHVS